MQEIIVAIIGLITVIIVAKKIMASLKKPASPCDGCTGCDLKNEFSSNNKPKSC